MSVQPSREWKILLQTGRMHLSDYVGNPSETLSAFAETNREFRAACDLAGVAPTRRQASRFKQKRGQAYAVLKS
jgi:hypothetical protein